MSTIFYPLSSCYLWLANKQKHVYPKYWAGASARCNIPSTSLVSSPDGAVHSGASLHRFKLLGRLCWAKYHATGKGQFLTQSNSWTTWCVISRMLHVTGAFSLDHELRDPRTQLTPFTKTCLSRVGFSWIFNHLEGVHKFYFGTTKCYQLFKTLTEW